MPLAQEILADPFIARYGYKDTIFTYYTCFPVDKNEKLYECIKGQFDTCYSDKFFWSSTIWKTIKVPRILPESYHETYIKNISPVHILKISQEK